MKETKDDITPEAILEKHNVIYFSKYNNSFVFTGDLLPSEMFERLIPALKEYATIQAARAWDSGELHGIWVQHAKKESLDEPPSKEQFLQSLK